jgi:hypothetical protein
VRANAIRSAMCTLGGKGFEMTLRSRIEYFIRNEVNVDVAFAVLLIACILIFLLVLGMCSG